MSTPQPWNRPKATTYALAGRVVEMKYWNNMLIWGGVDFDPANF